jgi:hypothetical protein
MQMPHFGVVCAGTEFQGKYYHTEASQSVADRSVVVYSIVVHSAVDSYSIQLLALQEQVYFGVTACKKLNLHTASTKAIKYELK